MHFQQLSSHKICYIMSHRNPTALALFLNPPSSSRSLIEVSILDEVKKHNRRYGKKQQVTSCPTINLQSMFEYISWISTMDTIHINFYEQLNLNVNIYRVNKQPAILVCINIPQLEDALNTQTLQRPLTPLTSILHSPHGH